MPLYAPPSEVLISPPQTLSGAAATVTFSSIPQQYTDLRISIRTACSGAAEFGRIQFNGDTGLNYDSEFLRSIGGTAAGGQSVGQTTALFGTVYPQTVAGMVSTFDLLIHGYAGTTFRKLGTSRTIAGADNTSANHLTGTYGFFWRDTSAITSVTILLTGGGNFIAGSEFRLYGVR